MRALQLHGMWEKIIIMLAKSTQMRNTFSNMADFPLPKENCIVDNTLFLIIQRSSLVSASILLYKVSVPSHLASCASMSMKPYALHSGSLETTPRYQSALINWLHKLGYSYTNIRKWLYFDGHERPDVIEA
jgi:hypothetical protein